MRAVMSAQTIWRTVGGGAIGLCVIMAVVGVRAEFLRTSPLVFFAFWGVFLVLFLVAIFCVLLDLRYIRLQYKLAKRELFHETLGDETFRRKLKKLAEEEAGQENGENAD